MKKDKQLLDFHNGTYVMGILNITPDSFSDGGKYNSVEQAVKRAIRMEQDGANIIDIGGESTRPNHQPITTEEELKRVIPVIEAVAKQVTIPISIDTYKARTAEEAIKAGASIINDIWGAKKDPQIANVAASYDVPIILMHNRNHTEYNQLIHEMIDDLHESIAIAKRAGVKDERIIIDPGIGFGKTLEDNYKVLQHLDEIIRQLSYPLLLGASRKSFISKVLPNEPAERDNATGATTVFGMIKGARIIRVHHVKKTVELVKMTEAMMKGSV